MKHVGSIFERRFSSRIGEAVRQQASLDPCRLARQVKEVVS
jgi:hypothetical protein